MSVTDFSTLDALAEITPVAPEKRLRIRFPLDGFTVSGGIRVITQIASGLAARGHEVTLIAPDYQSETSFALHPAVKILAVPTRRRGILRKIEYVLKLTQIAALDCELCFATSSRTPIIILLSVLLNRIRPRLIYLIQHYEVWSHAEQTARPWLIRKLLATSIKSAIGFRSSRLPFHDGFRAKSEREIVL